MFKFRVRLTLMFLILIGLSVAAAGLFTAKLVEKSYIQALRGNLERELRVIVSAVDWSKDGEAGLTEYFNEQALVYKQSAGARVTFIGTDGKVLGDSDHDSETMDNHLSRPEIVDAAAGGIGSSVRYSHTLGRNMLYVAVTAPPGIHSVGFIRLAMSLSDVESAVRGIWEFLAIGLALLFLVAGVISYRLARGMTKPLEKITTVAQRITYMEYGARARIPMDRKDEIGQLARAVNVMAESLERQLTRSSEDENRLKTVLENMQSGVLMIDRDGRIALLNRAAEQFLGFASDELVGKRFEDAGQQPAWSELIRRGLESRVPLRDEMSFHYPEERILEVNVSAIPGLDGDWDGVLTVMHNITAIRRLEKMRSEFVANVSHELKTPVAAVKGFAETLLSGAMHDPDTAQSFLQIIHDESDRLNRLIGDILELSKIESRQVPLQFSPVELDNFIDRTLHMVQSEADKKKIALGMEVPEGLFVEADEDRLRQIVTNLVANGIAYTSEGGRVTVSAEPIAADGKQSHDDDYEKIRLTVADTGIGIPKKDLPRIFERFYRVDKARSRSSGGTGLGLSIVKHLVEQHRGTIAVESEVGFGSRFIIELPVIHS